VLNRRKSLILLRKRRSRHPASVQPGTAPAGASWRGENFLPLPSSIRDFVFFFDFLPSPKTRFPSTTDPPVTPEALRTTLRRTGNSGKTVAMPKTESTAIEIAGHEVTITNPEKVYFPHAGYTKLDLAKYYAAVAEGALRGIAERPIVLKRYVNGAEGEPFFQKRAPEQHPDWDRHGRAALSLRPHRARSRPP
jgi:hypothetical protein